MTAAERTNPPGATTGARSAGGTKGAGPNDQATRMASRVAIDAEAPDPGPFPRFSRPTGDDRGRPGRPRTLPGMRSRKRPARALAAALTALGAAALVTAPAGAATPTAGSAGARARALCAGSPRTVGALADPALTETSGLAWSRAHRGVRWAHNDSGDGARVFALSGDGAALGTVTVTGADAYDWEDIAVGTGPGNVDSLFLADTGDRGTGGRTDVTVWRVPEPTPPGPGATSATERAVALGLTYPDGAHDAEALLVDDRSGDLVVVTKGADGRPTVYRAPGVARSPSGIRVTLEVVGTLGVPTERGASRTLLELAGLGATADQVTGADAATAGVAVVRTYGSIAVYRWARKASLASALLGVPCAAPTPLDLQFPQGEAIALAPDGRRLVTVSEGVGAPLVELRAQR